MLVAPLLLTVPFSVALVAVSALAATVVVVGTKGLHTGTEAVSVNVPKLVEPFVTPEITDVPDLVKLPDTCGDEAVGRT